MAREIFTLIRTIRLMRKHEVKCRPLPVFKHVMSGKAMIVVLSHPFVDDHRNIIRACNIKNIACLYVKQDALSGAFGSKKTTITATSIGFHKRYEQLMRLLISEMQDFAVIYRFFLHLTLSVLREG